MAETLDARWHRLLRRGSVERTYARTAVLWAERAGTEGLFLLEAGVLRLTREAADGEQILVGEESAPAAILMPGLFDGGPNCTTAKAITDCTVHILPRTRLLELCYDHPDLLLKLITALSCRDRRTADFIDLVTVGTVRQRVARLLLDLMRQNGSKRLALPHSHSTLAQSLGTVREVLYRRLKQLQSEGVLQFHGGEVLVEHEQALREAAGIINDRDPVFDRQAASPTPRYLALVVSPH